MDELESGDTGSILDLANQLQQDFEKCKIELISAIQGFVLKRRGHGMMKKLSKRYF